MFRALLVFVLLAAPAFADTTGFINPTTRREISPSGNSSPTTLKYGKTSSQQYQALFKYSLNIPLYSKITKRSLMKLVMAHNSKWNWELHL